MSKAIENLMKAMENGMKTRPKVGGFPYLAESLHKAGVIKNTWHLPSCQSLYLTKNGSVLMQGNPLVSGTVDVPTFDQNALLRALRADQAGESSFPEFLKASWEAGVISYDVDLQNRKVTYYGALGEAYVEAYPSVEGINPASE
jgi:uncharacterized protein YbcV (DUF1398 family)